MSEPQEEEVVAEEEEEEPEQVVMENESYVNLKKKLSKKYDVQAKSLYNENVKICAQFRQKKVQHAEHSSVAYFREIKYYRDRLLFQMVLFHPSGVLTAVLSLSISLPGTFSPCCMKDRSSLLGKREKTFWVCLRATKFLL